METVTDILKEAGRGMYIDEKMNANESIENLAEHIFMGGVPEMNSSECAYEALSYIADMHDAYYVLTELFSYLNVDEQVAFIHYFVKDNETDISELDDDCIRTLERHFEKHCK